MLREMGAWKSFVARVAPLRGQNAPSFVVIFEQV